MGTDKQFCVTELPRIMAKNVLSRHGLKSRTTSCIKDWTCSANPITRHGVQHGFRHGLSRLFRGPGRTVLHQKNQLTSRNAPESLSVSLLMRGAAACRAVSGRDIHRVTSFPRRPRAGALFASVIRHPGLPLASLPGVIQPPAYVSDLRHVCCSTAGNTTHRP